MTNKKVLQIYLSLTNEKENKLYKKIEDLRATEIGSIQSIIKNILYNHFFEDENITTEENRESINSSKKEVKIQKKDDEMDDFIKDFNK